MTPLMAFAVAALFLGIVVAIASLLGAATRRFSSMLHRRRAAAQPDAQRPNVRHGAKTRRRRVIRRSTHQSVALRRARRY